MSLDTVITELSRLCPGGVCRDVPLSHISRWRIGGHADVIVEPSSVDELQALKSFIYHEGLSSVVIGSTSNLLFSDDGLRAICIRLGNKMSSVKISGEYVEAEAGIWVPQFARKIMYANMTGAEHICGIPGTLGGLICMNGGSQRKAIGSAVRAVNVVDVTGNIIKFEQDECGFSYRNSIFQSHEGIIASAILKFELVNDRKSLRREMLDIMRKRTNKFPRKIPNCGSVFKSNPAMYDEIGPPGEAIESLGLKGYRIGDAVVSLQHGNFIVNAGNARATDMLKVIQFVKDTVFRTTGYLMEVEARFVKPDGLIVAADTAELTVNDT